ncbi:hypothetical protein [Burkholderia cepacia]|uniref:hypothetical protein n=1 Tax=Burkholderia cepacia TaxID=292 RepID=UPI00158B2168|nr:hypothetical protein [Burkholderia cepacia]MCA8057464.1 hypothetical protein [Burkholderia cepacia]MCA8133557.1 hypothetical protein [Burkholderia cepacia]MCA8161836.1 hypothetical protein [Burkholderia cepacia]
MNHSSPPLLPSPRLPLGKLIATPTALHALQVADISVYHLVNRHARHDWGDLHQADRQRNDMAVINGARVLSSYTLPNHVQVWIITEADRAVTTVLLPDEY